MQYRRRAVRRRREQRGTVAAAVRHPRAPSGAAADGHGAERPDASRRRRRRPHLRRRPVARRRLVSPLDDVRENLDASAKDSRACTRQKVTFNLSLFYEITTQLEARCPYFIVNCLSTTRCTSRDICRALRSCVLIETTDSRLCVLNAVASLFVSCPDANDANDAAIRLDVCDAKRQLSIAVRSGRRE